MKNQNPNRFLVVAIMLAITVAGLATGCPKKDAVRKAVEASYRLPAATNDIIAQVTVARDRGIITAEQARTFGEHLNNMARAEVVFVGMVKALNNTMQAGDKPDPAKLAEIKQFFDASIVEPFLRVLEQARILSGDSVQLILVAITAARLLMRTIGSGIGSGRMNTLAGPALR